ncbi:MAG: hypothetical protein FJ271_00960 [Planctomycetes bacterium]|nr:hypothetical protein [Planctomycetota bacterium]
MTWYLRATAAMAILSLATASAAPARAGDEPAADLAPITPVAQTRLLDYRYYSGPTSSVYRLSPDGKFAVGTGNGNQLLIYDADRRSLNRQPRMIATDNPNFYNPSIAFSSDGKTLIGMSNNYPDFNIHFWDVATGKSIRQIDNDQQFNSLAMSPDGTLLALGTSQRVEIWDAKTSDDVRTLTGPQNVFYQALSFSPDGRMLAGGANDVIQVWEVSTGRERLVVRLGSPQPGANLVNLGFRAMPQNAGFSSLAISADGAILAIGGNDGTIRLWSLKTGRELPPLMGHQGVVSSVVFTPDGKRLLSMDGQSTKLEWDVRRLGKVLTAKLRPPTDEEMAELWEGLGETDAFQTFRSVRWMSADPKRAVAFLESRLQAVPAGNADKIAQLVGELQNQNGAARRKAMAGLREHGEAALGALLQMAQNNQGFNQNVVMMIQKLDRVYTTGDRQRAVRAVPVLEQVGTDEAKQLLEKLAKGAAGARLTVAAKDALERIKVRPATLADADPKTLWIDLSSGDAAKAFRAIHQLAARADTAMPMLREHVKATPRFDPKRLDDLLAKIDSAEFPVRQQAMNELEKIGEGAVPTLKKTLTGQISLEARKRIEQLVQKLEGLNLSAAMLQQFRAVEVLERIGNNDARQLLQQLADGAPEARLTRDARDSLARLTKR